MNPGEIKGFTYTSYRMRVIKLESGKCSNIRRFGRLESMRYVNTQRIERRLCTSANHLPNQLRMVYTSTDL